jgi:hypothetical protein
MTLTHLNFLLGHPVHKSLTDINYEICVTVTIGIIKKIIINAFTNFFFVRHSEFENFFLCERILINVTTCQNETSS